MSGTCADAQWSEDDIACLSLGLQAAERHRALRQQDLALKSCLHTPRAARLLLPLHAETGRRQELRSYKAGTQMFYDGEPV